MINAEVVKILIRSNADLYAVDETGRNPLSLMSVKCMILKFHGKFITLVFSTGVTPVASVIASPIDFSRYMFSKTLSDVTFVVEGQEFPAHRIILCAVSRFIWAI